MSVRFGISIIFTIISSVALLPTLEAIDDCYDVGGLLVPVFTQVDKNGALATDIIRAYAQYLKDVGANGVVVGATTGEGPTLNVSDNKRLLDAWMEAAEPLNLYVISSVGGVPLPDAQEMSRYSEKIGVDAIFALPEVYYKPENAEELVYNMELIYAAAPNTPLVYDDYPQNTDVVVDIVRFHELATQRIPTYRGVKTNSLDNLLLLKTKIKGQQKLYAANYFYLAPEVCLGFKDFVLAEFNFFPSLIINIIKSRQEGNMKLSNSFYQKLLDLVEVITARGNRIAAEKEAMRLITCIDVGSVRPPIVPLSTVEKEDLLRNLQDYSQRGYFRLASCNYDFIYT